MIGVGGNCSAPLGMQDGRITDAQLTATSSYEPNLGKLFEPTLLLLPYQNFLIN
jgi:hypothetical protein